MKISDLLDDMLLDFDTLQWTKAPDGDAISPRRVKALIRGKIIENREDTSLLQKLTHRKDAAVQHKAPPRARLHSARPWLIAACAAFVLLAVPLGVYAYRHILQGAEVIDEQNQHLIGSESAGTYEILPNGQVSEYQEPQLPENRIITGTAVQNLIPNSILEVPEESGSYPKLIIPNGDMALLTQENGEGWRLAAGDSVTVSYKLYATEGNGTTLLLGHVKDSIIMEDELAKETFLGQYTFTASEDGVYYFYLMGASSDYVAVEKVSVEVE